MSNSVFIVIEMKLDSQVKSRAVTRAVYGRSGMNNRRRIRRKNGLT